MSMTYCIHWFSQSETLVYGVMGTIALVLSGCVQTFLAFDEESPAYKKYGAVALLVHVGVDVYQYL